MFGLVCAAAGVLSYRIGRPYRRGADRPAAGIALLCLVTVPAACFASDDGDRFFVENACGHPIQVELVEDRSDLQESDRLVSIDDGVVEFIVLTTKDPESVFVEAFAPGGGPGRESEVPAADFVEGPAGDFTVTLDSARCP